MGFLDGGIFPIVQRHSVDHLCPCLGHITPTVAVYFKLAARVASEGVAECVVFGDLRIPSTISVDKLALLASLNSDLQLTLESFVAVRMKISASEFEGRVLC